MTKPDQRLAVIGCGNMASAILKGIIQKRYLSKDDISIYDIDPSKTEGLRKVYGFRAAPDLETLLKDAKNILIAVKPQDIVSLLGDIKRPMRQDHVLISIAAGISISLIQKKTSPDAKVFRVMPNMPALYNRGVSIISKSPGITKEEAAFVTGMIGSFGQCIEVEEEMQNLCMALSGCGPAYFFLFCKTMADFGKDEGLDPAMAMRLVSETMAGSYEVIKNSQESLDALIAKVRSPGGATEKALERFTEMGLEKAVREGLMAAIKRSFELQKESEGL